MPFFVVFSVAGSDEAIAGCEHGRLSAIVDTQLVENTVDVAFHRVRADIEQFGYLGISVPFGYQTQNIRFTTGQLHGNGDVAIIQADFFRPAIFFAQSLLEEVRVVSLLLKGVFAGRRFEHNDDDGGDVLINAPHRVRMHFAPAPLTSGKIRPFFRDLGTSFGDGFFQKAGITKMITAVKGAAACFAGHLLRVALMKSCHGFIDPNDSAVPVENTEGCTNTRKQRGAEAGQHLVQGKFVVCLSHFRALFLIAAAGFSPTILV